MRGPLMLSTLVKVRGGEAASLAVSERDRFLAPPLSLQRKADGCRRVVQDARPRHRVDVER
jgi:hypothetical protein